MNNSIKIIFGLFVLFLGLYFLKDKFLLKPIPPQVINPLEGIVQTVIAHDQDYGVVVKNLKTGENYQFNQTREFESASLYKLWVMAETFRQIEQGLTSPEEILSEKVAVLNDKFNLDQDNAELQDGEISLSVSDALTQMITISHNYATLLLTEKIGITNLQNFLQNFAFNNSKVNVKDQGPTTTALGIANFFEKLYHGELASQESSQKMLELLKKQQLNNKLPKHLPAETVIAHKTGELDSFSHDAGIVYTPKGDYIIVVLSETDNPLQAEEKIALLSKAIYDYFSK